MAWEGGGAEAQGPGVAMHAGAVVRAALASSPSQALEAEAFMARLRQCAASMRRPEYSLKDFHADMEAQTPRPPPLPALLSQEENEIVGGVFEGKALDKDGVVAITKLPTKQELMEKTARLLKMLPQNLATTLHEAGAERLARATKEAAGQKVARAVKAVEGTKE